MIYAGFQTGSHGVFLETLMLFLYPDERAPLGRPSSSFLEWTMEEGMIDLGYVGPSFTLHHGNCVTQRRSARLDRALCDEEWRCLFPEPVVIHCTHTHSDHSPILLRVRGQVGV